MFKVLSCRFAAAVGIAVLFNQAHAETAEMLPAGIASVRYQYTVGHADDAYDADGHRKSLAALYAAGLSTAGLTTAVPSLYHINTGGAVDVVRHDLYLQYGITDEFGLGLWTNYLDEKVAYSASLVHERGWSGLSATDRATLSAAVGAADAADSSAAALGDTVLGVKQRLVGNNDSTFRFAYLLGVRLPTGHVADPTKAGDISTGDGQTDLGLWFSFDWVPSPDWLLNLHTRHEYQMTGSHTVLDPADAGRTLSQKFRPGFYTYVELKGRYTHPGPSFNTEFDLTAIYEGQGNTRQQSYDAATDSYHGNLQPVADSESRILNLEPQIGIDLFPSGIPLIARLYYGIPLQGKNALALRYVGVRLDAFW